MDFETHIVGAVYAVPIGGDGFGVGPAAEVKVANHLVDVNVGRVVGDDNAKIGVNSFLISAGLLIGLPYVELSRTGQLVARILLKKLLQGIDGKQGVAQHKLAASKPVEGQPLLVFRRAGVVEQTSQIRCGRSGNRRCCRLAGLFSGGCWAAA